MNNQETILLPELKQVSALINNEIVLELFVPNNLAFLNGHFDRIAIVPGVTQIHWAIYYARNYLEKHIDDDEDNSELIEGTSRLEDFYQMQVIKFKSLILPNTVINLSLRLSEENNKLYFRYFSQDQEFSSGRVYFKSE